ncbi:MAG: hypothetical protein IJP75_01560 [Bacteroidaceae bacterium]|nr:hypothetical protein [Bacteroidaceae bacterium]
MTRCPWHDDKHPSLTLHETGGENHCHCFACGKGGSTIDFVMAKEGIDFKAACEGLENAFGGKGFYRKTPENPEKPEIPEKPAPAPPTAYIPRQWVEAHVSVENSLSRCLHRLPLRPSTTTASSANTSSAATPTVLWRWWSRPRMH